MRTVSGLTAKDDRALLREIEIDRRYLASVRRKLSRSLEEMAEVRAAIEESVALLQADNGTK
jgi:hypothetical protein